MTNEEYYTNLILKKYKVFWVLAVILFIASLFGIYAFFFEIELIMLFCMLDIPIITVIAMCTKRWLKEEHKEKKNENIKGTV